MEEPNASLPWVEKYRPTSVDQILSHTEIIDTITRLVDNNQMPHLLLYGPAGTGKTSTVMAIARRLYKDNLKSNVLELNASDERGIDVVRSQIKEFASTRQLFGKDSAFKLVVLDEADQMTNEAQAALRRVIEMYTRNVRFCIICNYVNKILPAIQSRCTRFRFGPLGRKQVVQRLREVCTAEKTPFTDEALNSVFILSGGDMRKSLNILQGTAMANTKDEITDDDVHTATGSPSKKIIRQIINYGVNTASFAEAANGIRGILSEHGLALADIVREVHPWLIKVDIPADTRCWAISSLSDIEHQLCFSCNDKIQLSGFISVLQIVRASAADGRHISTVYVKAPMER